MTTFGPPPASTSLLERLVGAQVAVLGRLRGLTKEWPDPCGRETAWFGLLEVDVHETLRGEAPDRILVRIRGTRLGSEVEWAAPVDEGEDVLLLVSLDDEGDPPRYALQYDSGFRLVEGVLEVPEDLPLGEYALEPGQLPLETVHRMILDLAAAEAERRKEFDEVEGRGWTERDYPKVEEIGDPLEQDRPRREPGPREGWPTTQGPHRRRDVDSHSSE